MSSGLYSRFLKLCKSWPLDPAKTTRDFGLHLQKQLQIWFPKGKIGCFKYLVKNRIRLSSFKSKIFKSFLLGELTLLKNANNIEKQIASLERLNMDIHKRKYADTRVIKLKTASLFTKDQIKKTMTTEFLEENDRMYKITKKKSIRDQKFSAIDRSVKDNSLKR